MWMERARKKWILPSFVNDDEEKVRQYAEWCPFFNQNKSLIEKGGGKPNEKGFFPPIFRLFLQHIVQFVALKDILLVIGDAGIGGDERVLRPDVQRVVDAPVVFSHSPGGVEQSLQSVLQQTHGAEGDTHRLHRGHEGLRHVRGCLENVGPHAVQQVVQRVLAAKPEHAQRHVGHGGAGGLPVDEISDISERKKRKMSNLYPA